MPKIVQYEPNQVSTQIASKPKMNAASGNAVFDANIQAGQSITEGVVKMRQRIDTTSAEEALVGFEREKNDLFFKPKTGYFNQQGKNAYDQMGATDTALQELRKRYADGLTGDAAAMFGKAADAHIARSHADIQRHGSDGYKAWEISTLDAQVENALETGALYWANDQMVGESRALGEIALRNSAELSGISQIALDERIQTFHSSFAEAAIEAATLSSAEKGSTMLEKHGDYLEPPMRAKLEAGIASKLEAEDAKFRAEMAIGAGAKLVDAFDSREEIRAEVNQIEDPTQRKQTMAEAMRQFDLKKKGIAEAQDTVLDAAEEHLYGGQSIASFVAANPDDYNSLTAKQKRSLDKLAEGGPAASKSNPVLLADLIHQDPVIVAKIDASEYRDQLSGSEYGKLKKAVFDAGKPASEDGKARARLGQTRNTQINEALITLVGAKKDWSNETRNKVNHFYDLIDSEYLFRKEAKGLELSSAEFTDMLGDLTREEVIINKLFGFDSLLPDGDHDLDDLPADKLRGYAAALRRHGKAVNINNLRAIHLRAEASN